MKMRITSALILVFGVLLHSTGLRAACFDWAIKRCMSQGQIVALTIPSCGQSAWGTVVADATMWSYCPSFGGESFAINTIGAAIPSTCYFVATFTNPCTYVSDCGVFENTYYLKPLMTASPCVSPNPRLTTPAVNPVPSCTNAGPFELWQCSI